MSPATFGLGQAPVSNNNETIEPSTPWTAAADGKLDLLQSSLSQLRLPVTATDENGYGFFHAAASYGHIPVLQWLLAQNRTIANVVDNEGDSALHYACTVDTAKLLLEVAGVSPDIKNQCGKTALEIKQEELQEMMADEDYDEDDEDATNLRKMVEFLSSLVTGAQ